MGAYYNPNEFRASSSAFAWGDLVHTKYKTGCLRKILIQSRDVNAYVEASNKRLGDMNEERHAARLTAEGRRFVREYGFRRPIEVVEGISFSGHIDFIIYDDVSAVSVDELKGSMSKNLRRDVIKNGDVQVENLAQLVAYMGEARVAEGRLIYTYYEDVSKGEGEIQLRAMDERIFAVNVDAFGKIWVDGNATQFHYIDVVAHRVAAARVIKEGLIGPRPLRHDAPFIGVCAWCPFKVACDVYDEMSGAIEGTDAFVEYARTLVNGETK